MNKTRLLATGKIVTLQELIISSCMCLLWSTPIQ